MELDITKVMILLQRKWNSIREIHRLTIELEKTFARNDEISAAMLLQLRSDEMEKIDQCMEEIWQLGETDPVSYEKLCVLINSDPDEAVGETAGEKKIYEIRQRTQVLLDQLQEADKRLNQKLAGKKSFYKK